MSTPDDTPTVSRLAQWADRAGLSGRIPRDHLAMAAALSGLGHPVEVVRYHNHAQWDDGTRKSTSGWFLRGNFGFFSLEGADSEAQLRRQREEFMDVLYPQAGAGRPSAWQWDTHIALPVSWRTGVDPERLAALRATWPVPAPAPRP